MIGAITTNRYSEQEIRILRDILRGTSPQLHYLSTSVRLPAFRLTSRID